MRTRELLIALAAGLGACVALHHILAADRGAPPAPPAAAAERDPTPGPAAFSPPRKDDPPAAGDPGSAATDDFHSSPAAEGTRPEAVEQTRSGHHPEFYFANGEEARVVEARLGREDRYPEWLRLFHRLWGGRELGIPESGATPTAANRDSNRLAERLARVLEGAEDPLARQALIFHAAIALPSEIGFPLLRKLRTSSSGEDCEDALLALAFLGDPDARRDFSALAAVPAEDAGCLRCVRRAMRSVEVVLGRPYLHVNAWWYLGEAGEDPFPWAPSPPRVGDETAREALAAWIRRYPGHPGSDDVAWRLANIALRAGDRVDALRWASRAATYPDQDMSRPAAVLLVTVAELTPLDSALLAVLPDPLEPSRNRNLLTYIRLRRLATERGFAQAVEEVQRIASAEPELPLSRAFLSRWAEPLPKGLDSGGIALPAADPLRRVAGMRIEESVRANPATTWRREDRPLGEDGTPLAGEAREEARRKPNSEVLRLPLRRLAFQMRCWSTIAELEMRASTGSSPVVCADLRYKAAAILYHERDSVYPLYAQWSINRSGRPEEWRLPEDAERPSPNSGWLHRNLPHLRAAAEFETLRDAYPGSTIGERAAFSAGLAWIKAAQDPPVGRAWDWWCRDEEVAFARTLIRRGAEAFERCAIDYPSSPLATDAAAAAAYWRRTRPEAFR